MRSWEREAEALQRRLVSARMVTCSSVWQIGKKDQYRSRPRFDRPELDLSVLADPVADIDDAVRASFGRSAKATDTIRELDVQLLRDHGYEVIDTASGHNPRHASILGPRGRGPSDQIRWWDDASRVTLDEIQMETARLRRAWMLEGGGGEG